MESFSLMLSGRTFQREGAKCMCVYILLYILYICKTNTDPQAANVDLSCSNKVTFTASKTPWAV